MHTQEKRNKRTKTYFLCLFDWNQSFTKRSRTKLYATAALSIASSTRRNLQQSCALVRSRLLQHTHIHTNKDFHACRRRHAHAKKYIYKRINMHRHTERRKRNTKGRGKGEGERDREIHLSATAKTAAGAQQKNVSLHNSFARSTLVQARQEERGRRGGGGMEANVLVCYHEHSVESAAKVLVTPPLLRKLDTRTHQLGVLLKLAL